MSSEIQLIVCLFLILILPRLFVIQQPLISVVIPAFNEANTIGSVISDTMLSLESFGMPFEVIVVDDGSTDGTTQIATGYKVTVLANGKNRGKGYALRKGFHRARGNVIVTIDADGSHNPKEIPSLISRLLHGVDIVTGSRFQGHGEASTSRLHRLGNCILSYIILILTEKRVADSQTGFRAFRKEVLRKFNLTSSGFDIETEFTVKALTNGFALEERPIKCQKREYGASSLRIHSDGIKIFKAILKAKFMSTG
jgi:glycosyltransferase involved in cell wall biosynthesis